MVPTTIGNIMERWSDIKPGSDTSGSRINPCRFPSIPEGLREWISQEEEMEAYTVKRVEVLGMAAYLYADGSATLGEIGGKCFGVWINAKEEAPAFVRKALGIKYVHPSQEVEFQRMRICDWFQRGQSVGA